MVERLRGTPYLGKARPKPRVAWNRIERSRLVRIESFEYVEANETLPHMLVPEQLQCAGCEIIGRDVAREVSGGHMVPWDRWP